MDIDIFGSVVGAAVLVGILISIYFVYQRSCRTMRRLVRERLEGYFQGDMPADQLGKRIREIAGRHFIQGTELYSLVIAAFQGAVDARLSHKTLSEQDEKKIVELVGGFEERVWTDGFVPD